jgi:energy-coupling factor transport system substrate-specific component
VHANTSSINRFSWRIIDIVIAAVFGVVAGVIFFAGDLLYTPLSALLGVTPGLEGLTAGFWLFGPVLGGLVIRKPGAAIFVSLVGAIVEVALGSTWGTMNLWVGLIQGLGAEIGFAAFGYASSRLIAAVVAGALAGVANAAVCLPLYYAGTDVPVLVIYAISAVVSGIVLAGVLSFIVAKALSATGALSRFPIGKTA